MHRIELFYWPKSTEYRVNIVGWHLRGEKSTAVIIYELCGYNITKIWKVTSHYKKKMAINLTLSGMRYMINLWLCIFFDCFAGDSRRLFRGGDEGGDGDGGDDGIGMASSATSSMTPPTCLWHSIHVIVKFKLSARLSHSALMSAMFADSIEISNTFGDTIWTRKSTSWLNWPNAVQSTPNVIC